MKPGGVECPRCGHRHVLPGRLVNFLHGGLSDRAPKLMFQTEILMRNFLPRLFGKKLAVWIHEAPHLCQDCGLVWSNVDPRLVRDEIRTHARPEEPTQAFSDARHSVMADHELDGPF